MYNSKKENCIDNDHDKGKKKKAKFKTSYIYRYHIEWTVQYSAKALPERKKQRNARRQCCTCDTRDLT